jgi:hypothetical protein
MALAISGALFSHAQISHAQNVDVAVHAASVASLRFVGLIDKTISTKSRIPQPSIDDFEPLFQRLRVTGGDVAIGLIDEDVAAPFLRLHIEAPPTKPEEPSGTNAIDRALKLNRYRTRDLPTYLGALRRWQEATEELVRPFRTVLSARLAREVNARFSPINVALLRAQTFLQESPAETLRVVIVSDGLDTTNQPRPHFDDSVGIFVVGALTSPGFGDLPHRNFETLRAALEQLD